MSIAEVVWNPALAMLVGGSDGVHMWRATLNLLISRVASLGKKLAADKRRRAERFYFQKDRMHFVVARGLLGTILGRHPGRDPHALQFCSNPYGKQGLASKSSGCDASLNFNVTHASALALYTVTYRRAIGIDSKISNGKNYPWKCPARM